MSDCFKIYGPFEIESKEKIVDKEHQTTYWAECVDKEHPDLSMAKGIYLFSLRNAENYNPQYVGKTGVDFRSEVFNYKNRFMILRYLQDQKGVLCLHLLAKPKPSQQGFTRHISEDELYWIEDYIQQTCRIKNPELLNIGKSTFLLRATIEGITDDNPSWGGNVKTFKNALGIGN
jgi:hypothetical protein